MAGRRIDNKGRVLKEGERQRKDGIYEYRYYDKFGKRHSVYAGTKAELQIKKDKVLRDKLNGIHIDNSKMTINDMYEKWKKLKRGLKGNTFRNYQYMYERFIQKEFGKNKLINLRRSDVKEFYIELADNGMKASTIDSIHTCLHQVIEMAVDDDIIRYNPSDKALKELKQSELYASKKRNALTIDEEKLFINYLKNSPQNKRWYPVFLTMLRTGMRVGEVLALTWNDIEFDQNLIYVNRTLVYYRKLNEDHSQYEIHTPKTKAGTRKIPMLAEVKEALLLEKQYQLELGISCNCTINGYTDFVFLNQYGSVLNLGILNKALSRIVRECNEEIIKNSIEENPLLVPKMSNHILRHTYATRLNEASINTKAMQAILGHSDIQTTMDIYTDATDELLEQAIKEFEKHFEKSLPLSTPITTPKYN